MNFFFIKDRATQFLKRFYKRYAIAHKNKNLTHSIIPEPYVYKQDSTATHELKKLIVHADFLSFVQKVFPECVTGESVNMRIMQSSDLVRLHEYKIIVAEHITIIYSDGASLYYALLDLKTVLDQRIIHHTEIHNFAKHAWRGMHIDVARHYMPLSFLYELIDEMAKLKLNYLHFHVSDDQGFRFESKLFPELHKKGSERRATVVGKQFFPFMEGYVDDAMPHGGYYTQDELRALVQYAKEKYITIVPEIDIPGHVGAITYAYPNLAAHKAPSEVQARWGIFPYGLKPHQDTLTFLKKLIDEVDEVFDSPYIHLGGDEVLYNYYKKDNATKSLISQKVLETYKDAPWYILEQMCEYVRVKNKIPIVWNDAYKVAIKVPGTHVMIWQSMEEIRKIQNHNVPYICSSASHFYFDYYQKKDIAHEPLAIGGYTPIESVYKAPLKQLTPNCIGVQANMWTEYTKTPESVWYMIRPRIYALAECAWGRYAYSLDMFMAKLKQWKLL